MISKLFKPRAKRDPTPAPSVPKELRLYAIGDVHGRLDLLQALLSRIEQDNAARGDATVQLLFLGDIVDRGPQSAAVVDLLAEVKERYPATRFIMGNHEEVFLLAVQGDMKALRFFTRIGGRETILSYGVDLATYDSADFDELMALMISRVPQRHIDFLSAFEDLVVIGDYAFVHAGVRPGVPLMLQKTADLRWIREAFLNHDQPFEKVIVHGHTISSEVEVTAHRIGLDTGAYESDILSAMGFEGTDRWIVQN